MEMQNVDWHGENAWTLALTAAMEISKLDHIKVGARMSEN